MMGFILGYGLCSNGVVGVQTQNQPLIVPRVHDCISLFLGSAESHRNQLAEYPGTYYLTARLDREGSNTHLQISSLTPNPTMRRQQGGSFTRK